MQDITTENNYFLLTRTQIRAGRTIAGLGVRDLAIAAGLSPTAVSQIETGRTEQPHESTLRSLRTALEEHGVQFNPGGWLRRRDDAFQHRLRSSENTLPRIIARNVKAARKTLAMSVHEVAACIEQPVELYARIEAGALIPPVPIVLSIACALQVSTDYLLSHESRPNEHEAPVESLEQLQIKHMLRTANSMKIRIVLVLLRELERLDNEFPQ